MQKRNAILITGLHRSGSAWISKVLSLAPNTACIQEPFALKHPVGQLAAAFHWSFPYITDDNEGPYLQPVSDMLEFRYRADLEMSTLRSYRDATRLVEDYICFARYRRAQALPVLRDTQALFSAEWLARQFGVRILVVSRHPAAYASSLKRLGWSHPFEDFLGQPLLMRDFLAPYRSQIEEFAAKTQPALEQAILLWQLIHHTILQYRQRHPDWLFLRHEDLCRAPVEQFRKVFNRLGLAFGSDIEKKIRAYSAESNPVEPKDPLAVRRNSRETIWKWRRTLSDDEVRRVRCAVEHLSREFYDDADWDPNPQQADESTKACQVSHS